MNTPAATICDLIHIQIEGLDACVAQQTILDKLTPGVSNPCNTKGGKRLTLQGHVQFMAQNMHLHQPASEAGLHKDHPTMPALCCPRQSQGQQSSSLG